MSICVSISLASLLFRVLYIIHFLSLVNIQLVLPCLVSVYISDFNLYLVGKKVLCSLHIVNFSIFVLDHTSSYHNLMHCIFHRG